MDPELLLEEHLDSSSDRAAVLIVAGWSSTHHVFSRLLTFSAAFHLVDDEHVVSSFISHIEFLQARVLPESIISNLPLLTLIKSAATRNGIYCVWLKQCEVFLLHALCFFPLMSDSLSFASGCYSKLFTCIN